MHGEEELYSELYSKHFKTHYAGKPTRRFIEINEKLNCFKRNEIKALNLFNKELTSFN